MRVQEEMVRRANLRSGEGGKKKRIYSSKYALSSICTCDKCGDVYRRIAWNNRGKKYTVWRCCNRVEHGPGGCDAPTILETDLQAAVMKAINNVLGRKSEVIAKMESLLEQAISFGFEEEIAAIDSKMNELQEQLIDINTSKKLENELNEKICDLRAERDKIIVAIAGDKDRQRKKEELVTFLQEQTAEFDEFDDALVRRLIEQITVHEDGAFTSEFKSGTKVEV